MNKDLQIRRKRFRAKQARRRKITKLTKRIVIVTLAVALGAGLYKGNAKKTQWIKEHPIEYYFLLEDKTDLITLSDMKRAEEFVKNMPAHQYRALKRRYENSLKR